MDEFRDILSERRKTSDILWVTRNWDPACAYIQSKKSNPDDIKNRALVGAPLRIIMQEISKSRNMSPEALKKTITVMLEEIAFKRATSVLRVLAWITSKLTKSLLYGVMVNENKFLSIKSEFGKNPVLLVPSHRSYGDFILMSFICFHYDVDIPRIAAGVDFQAMSVTSSILRKACAFYMRRTFNTDRLYSAVFEQYVNTLITNGDASVEFFIEGTRSRTGKSLPPKYGFLKMALRSFFTACVPDITLVPVSFSYDRVMEERLFAYELLGIPKPKESTKGLLKACGSILNEKLGFVYVNFGDPVSAKEYFGFGVDRSVHNYGPVQLQELTSDEFNHISRLAHTIVRQQQKLTVITCFNLMATMINQHVTERCTPLILEELVCDVEWLASVMKALGATVTLRGDLFETVSMYIRLHKSFLTVTNEGKIKLLVNPAVDYDYNKGKTKGHNMAKETMDIAVPYIMLQFYSNPCSSFLINLSFVSVIVNYDRTGALTVDEMFDQFQFLRTVFSSEFDFQKETEDQDFAAAFEFAKNQKMIVQLGSEIKAGENVKLGQFCVSFIRLYIYSYLLVIDVLSKESNSVLPTLTISKSYQKTVESLLMEGVQIHPASLSLSLVDNALISFDRMGVTKKMRRKNVVSYAIHYHRLKMVKNRLGYFGAVTKLNGKILQHMENFMYCKY